MSKRYNEKRQKKLEFQVNKELDTGADGIDVAGTMANDLKAAAMGGKFVARKLSTEVSCTS